MRSESNLQWGRWIGCAAILAWLSLAGCATTPPVATARPFVFERDTLSFTNHLAWDYGYDDKGRWNGKPRDPKPDYTLRCFPMSRTVIQFFQHARFDPTQPPADEETTARLLQEILARSPRTDSASARRVVIPGYTGLREFSEVHETLLKSECGGASASYLQRGHWRMVFPFFSCQQSATAKRIATRLRAGRPVVLHLLRFPETGTINHAVVAFAVDESERVVDFSVYDPNLPAAPVTLRFDRTERTFEYPPTHYFEGGPLDVYQVYHRWYY